MSWMQTVPWLAATALFLAVPGAVALRAWGVRGLAVPAGAVPATAGIAAITAVLAQPLGLRFTVLLLLLATALVSLAGLGVRILRARSARPRRGESPARPLPAGSSALSRVRASALRARGRGWPDSLRARGPEAVFALACAAAVVVSGFVVFYRYAHGFGAPDRVSQTFDNVYHLSAVRTILDTGSGSSLTLGNLTPETRGFYPAAWHDVTALAVSFLGLSIPVTVNLVNIVVGALVWPLSLLFLVTRVTGSRVLPVLLTGVVAPAFPAFPYLLVDMGVLYPTHLAVAVLPVALGAVVELLGLARGPVREGSAHPAVLLCGVLPGLMLSHPTTVLALLAFSLPLMIARLVRERASRGLGARQRRRFLVFCGVFGAYAVLTLALWIKARPPAAAANWPPEGTVAQAVGEVLTGTPLGLAGGLPMLVLSCAGIAVILLRRRQRWVLGMLAVGAVLYVVCAGFPVGPLRMFLTGGWYNDANRLAALLPVVTAPVVVIGAEALLLAAVGLLTRAPARGLAEDGRLRRIDVRLAASAGIALLALAAIGAGLQGEAMQTEQKKIAKRYLVNSESSLLDAPERRLLERLPGLVPKGHAVVANPRNGGSLAYALEGVPVLKPHVHGAVSSERQLLLDHWGEAASNPAVCRAVRSQKADYALDFGPPYVSWTHPVLPGLTDLDKRPGVELVAQEGAKAKLYRLTACG